MEKDQTSQAIVRDCLPLFEVLDSRGRAAVALDLHTRILGRNTSASRLLSPENGFHLTPDRQGDRLECLDPGDQRTLQTVLNQLPHTARARGSKQAEFIMAGSNDPLHVEVFAAPEPSLDNSGGPCAILILTPLGRADPDLGDRLRALFQLTAREGSVAAQLSGPYSEAEIAQTLKISDNTLRSHRKSIYAKLGVGSRAAFTALIARLV